MACAAARSVSSPCSPSRIHVTNELRQSFGESETVESIRKYDLPILWTLMAGHGEWKKLALMALKVLRQPVSAGTCERMCVHGAGCVFTL